MNKKFSLSLSSISDCMVLLDLELIIHMHKDGQAGPHHRHTHRCIRAVFNKSPGISISVDGC